MVGQGFDVYLIDWGYPGPEDKGLTFADYVLEYLPRAIRKLKQVSGADEFSMLGWCIDAVIASMYVALRPDDGLRNLILLTAPLDFTDKEGGGFIDLYRENRLVEGTMKLRGKRVDLGHVRANLLAIEAADDHIVPPRQTEGAIGTSAARTKSCSDGPPPS